MKLSIILTGATGMVGEGVLHECLLSPLVENILVVSRKSCGLKHLKLKEVLVNDFFQLDTIEKEFIGYNACFFCLGVSSIGMKEPAYKKLTYDLTLHFATTLKKSNPELTFCYISGASTDSTEKGRSMWARVKGKTENDLMKLFNKAYMFRPGYMQPTHGLKNTLPYYKYFSWMYPAFRFIFPNFVSTLKELGLAMINTTAMGNQKQILEVNDIVKLSHK